MMRFGLIALVGTIIGVGLHGCKDPKDARKYYNQGVARLEKGEFDAAISDLTKAIKVGRDLSWPTFIVDARTSAKANMTRPSQT